MNKAIGILPFFAHTHAAFLHARGRFGTLALIDLLDCRAGENILDIGCGTGATLVMLASLYGSKTCFWGAEVSTVMCEKAKARLKFCLLDKRVQVKQMEQADRLPFESDAFDKVYLESVLAIQEGENLKKLLLEIRRVLKPGGILLMNETIWLDSTPKDQIASINAATKTAFGIIQSNASVPYLEDWINLLHNKGYRILASKRLGEPDFRFKYSFKRPYSLLSRIYTIFGKLKSIYSKKYRAIWQFSRREMQQIIPPGIKLMEGILIKAVNEKPNEQHRTSSTDWQDNPDR